MSESLLNAEQRKLFGEWVLCLRQRERTSAREAADMLEAALAEIDRLSAALADAEKLLAIVAQDEETGAAEVGAAREREACAAEAAQRAETARKQALAAQGEPSWTEAEPDRLYAVEESLANFAAAIRARGPCLAQPAEEGELERLRAEVKRLTPALTITVAANGGHYEQMDTEGLCLRAQNNGERPITFSATYH